MVQTSSRFSPPLPPGFMARPLFMGAILLKSRKKEKRGGGGNEDGEKKFGEREIFLFLSPPAGSGMRKVQENRGGVNVPFIARNSVRISPWGQRKRRAHIALRSLTRKL